MKTSSIRRLVAVAALSGALGSVPARADHVYVRVAPPVPIVEVRPPMPTHGHVWVGGHHAWNGSAHVWVHGSWQLPPPRHRHWVPGRWHHYHRRGYYWVDGHWR